MLYQYISRSSSEVLEDELCTICMQKDADQWGITVWSELASPSRLSFMVQLPEWEITRQQGAWSKQSGKDRQENIIAKEGGLEAYCQAAPLS